MPLFDLPLEQLRNYTPDLPVPDGLRGFWDRTLREAREHRLDATFTPHDTGLVVVDTFDVTFTGAGGARVRGWLHLPARTNRPLPAVVEYIGYGGGRGLAHQRTLYAQAGYAHLVMDTRGQGADGSVGDTADPQRTGSPSHPGFLTDGVLDPEEHYYRRVYVDGVRAVEAARAHALVDPSNVVVTGASQGGGITLAVAALADARGLGPGLVGVAADVPFLADFPRATTLVDTDPYGEVARYLATHRNRASQVHHTLAHFDVAILGRWATAPALFSVGLMDEVCPPSTVYAAYNHYGGPGAMREYAYNAHEGGGEFHEVVKLRWLADRFGSAATR